MRKAITAEDEQGAGRRGAELADMLDEEDVDRIATAVERGSVAEVPRVKLSWEEELLGGGEVEEEDDEFGAWAKGEGPKLFLL